MFKRHLGPVLVLVVAAHLSLAASALAFVPWTNDSGTATFFDWENGGSDNGFFGDPTVVGGNTFVFFPQDFRADSLNGVAGSKADRLEFDLIAHAGFEFTDIVITEFGDYGVFGTGQVSVSGGLFVTDLNPANPFHIKTDSLVSVPPSPMVSGAANWTASAGANFAGDPLGPWTHFKLILDNNLVALSDPGSNTFIQKKVTGSAVSVTIIPEPASLSLLALGGLGMLRKKRR